MAKQPQDAVQFTYESAERIADVVRAVETTPQQASALRFSKVANVKTTKQIRAATFTGAWSVGSIKTVYLSAQAGIARATNNLASIPESGTRNCVIGREGTSWYLINWQTYTANAVSSAVLTSSSLKFNVVPIVALKPSSDITFDIPVINCTTS